MRLDILTIWQQSLAAAWGDLTVRFLVFLPVFLGAILIFVAGILVAGWVSQFVGHVLRVVRLPQVTKTAGIDGFLKRADISYDTVGLIAVAAKWFILLVFFVASVNVLGLTAITQVLNGLVAYVPKVIAAALIVAVGVFVANLVYGLVRGALATVDHGHAKPLAKIAQWLVIVVAVMAAINELAVAQTLVATFFQGLTWTITLAVGLAVGLGAKDLVAELLRDWHDRLKK